MVVEAYRLASPPFAVATRSARFLAGAPLFEVHLGVLRGLSHLRGHERGALQEGLHLQLYHFLVAGGAQVRTPQPVRPLVRR